MMLSVPSPWPQLNYICVCSGISAPTQAWAKHGWKALAFAEIDPFASAILAYRYGASRPRFMPQPEDAPDQKEARRRAAAIRALDRIEWGNSVRNEGDFTRMRDEDYIVDADVLVGGTPCQAFSLAGLRRSLSDDRGNLALEFIRLADAVDDLRGHAGKPPAFILWENVPGVFTVEDNAFGAFLAGLVGSDEPIVPPAGGGWPDAGVVSGPSRVAAWRVLDTQHFGLPQRRRRVFVLARRHPGAWVVADALLPIIDSLRGHPAPSRKAGEGAAGRAGLGVESEGGRLDEPDRRGVGGSGSGGGDCGGGHRGDAGVHDGSPAVAGTVSAKWAKGTGGPSGDEHYNLVTVDPIPFDTTQITHPENRSNLKAGDPAPTLARQGHPPAIAFTAKDHGQDDSENVSPTLRAMQHDGSHANGGGQVAVVYASEVASTLLSNNVGGQRTTGLDGNEVVAVAVPISSDALREGSAKTATPDAIGNVRKRDPGLGVGDEGDPAFTLTAAGPSVVAFSMRGRGGENMIEPEAGDVAPALRTGDGGSSKPFVAYALSPGAGSEGAPSAVETEVAHALTGEGEASRNGRGTHIVEPQRVFRGLYDDPRRFAGKGDVHGGGDHGDLAPTLETTNPKQILVESEPFAFKPSHYTRGKDGAPSDLVPALTADADKGDQDPVVMAFNITPSNSNADYNAREARYAQAITASHGPPSARGGDVVITTAVRRLTCRECERLQGFPDDFTLIPYSDARRDEQDFAETVAYLLAAGHGDNEAKVLAATPDGPRYRVLGNTMSVDVIENLGGRVAWAASQ